MRVIIYISLCIIIILFIILFNGCVSIKIFDGNEAGIGHDYITEGPDDEERTEDNGDGDSDGTGNNEDGTQADSDQTGQPVAL